MFIVVVVGVPLNKELAVDIVGAGVGLNKELVVAVNGVISTEVDVVVPNQELVVVVDVVSVP